MKDTDRLVSQTDEEIVVRVQQGDSELFGVLMERYYKKLLRYGKRFVSDSAAIEDSVQDIFISTYKTINSFNPSLKFSSWLYRIAHNAFVNALRKQQRSHIPVPSFDLDVIIPHSVDEDAPPSEEELRAMREMIDRGLEKVKPKYREVLILHFLEDFSYKDISDILKIPIGTVGIRVMRGKEALRKACEAFAQEKNSLQTYE